MTGVTEVWLPRGEVDALQLHEATQLGLASVVAEVVAARTSESLDDFLKPHVRNLPRPDLLPDMDQAAHRLADAIEAGERVTVFGDYDADGCTAAAVLYRFLNELGCPTHVRLPHRLKDGYGLATSMVDGLAPDCDVLITVDCGATAFEALERAQELSLPVIVCDHHSVAETIPPAIAVINPKRLDNEYPPGEPAAVGVAWNLVAGTRAVLRQRGYFNGRDEPRIELLMALVAIGTVADMVPLTGANRIFVRRGLRELERTSYAGLKVLRTASKDPALTERSLGFDLAPRLNAAGRLADAHMAFQLLVTDDPQEAQELFAQLEELNASRRSTQRSTVDEVMRRVRRAERLPDCIVAYDAQWHPGVVGLAAGRLVDRYHRPAVVIGMQGKGSARAPDGINLVAALGAASGQLARFGGHQAAAGLTLKPDADVARLRSDLNLAVRDQVGEHGHRKRLLYDTELAPWQAHLDIAQQLRQIAPFGMANPQPVFLAKGLEIRRRNDYKSDFTRLAVAAPVQSGQVWMDGFRIGRAADTGSCVDVLYELHIDRYKGEWQARRRVIALRMAQA